MKAALLIHGFLSDKEDFARLLPFLQERYDFVCCQNLPAHGTDRPKKSRVKKEETIKFVEDLFDGLKEKYQSVDVFGFSMGGALAAYLACIRKVDKLILLAPALKAPAYLFLFSRIRFWLECKKENRLSKKGKSPKKPIYGIRISSKKDIKADSKFARKYLFRVLFPRVFIRNYLNFKKIIKCCNKALKPIDNKTLILWGRLDQLVPHGAIKKISGYCSDCTKVVYRDISHLMLHSCAHNAMTDTITQFLDNQSI